MIYIYLKTHNQTGLMYLGKTTQDPFKYKGSGTYWRNHIKKHGYDVTTKILQECETAEQVKQYGLYYSDLYDVVHNKLFANLKEEAGDGGNTSSTPGYIAAMKTRSSKPAWNKGLKLPSHTAESNKQRSDTLKKHWETHQHNRKGALPWNKGISTMYNGGLEKTRGEWQCPHCHKSGSGLANARRWHFDNCKHV